MRNYSTVSNGISWNIDYPDLAVFAFNPQFCNISTSTSILQLQVSVSNSDTRHTIEVYLLKGKANVEISRIIQLFFSDYLNVRSLPLTLTVSYNGASVFVTTFMALWGGLSIGERFHQIGLFSDSDPLHYQKSRIWFKNFPFTVSMFSESVSPSVHGAFDSRVESAISVYGSRYVYDYGHPDRYGIFEMVPHLDFPSATREAYYRIGDVDYGNTFDYTFDFTFHGTGDAGQFFKLTVSDRKEGFYLRWIDKFGQIQYFLFDKGTVSLKNTLEKYETPEEDEERGGLYFPNIGRIIEITGEETCTCCAVSLPDEIYEYVSTIVTSPVIDLLVSFDSQSQQIWLPVNIVSSSFEYRPGEKLHDLTISFVKPIKTQPQSVSSNNGRTLLEEPRPSGYPLTNDTGGFYIRWTDYLGNLRFQYFTKGNSSIKNSIDKNIITIEDIRVGSDNFGDISRNMQVNGQETVKCCAVSIPEDNYEDIATIVRATRIDLYLGTSSGGTQIWMPINIVSASHVFDYSERLHDLIISFTKPAINTQSL